MMMIIMLTWMMQTTPKGRRKKGPCRVLNKERETKAVLHFHWRQRHRELSRNPTLNLGCCFLDQQGHMWQRIQRRPGRERSSTSDTVKHQCQQNIPTWFLNPHYLSSLQILERLKSCDLGFPGVKDQYFEQNFFLSFWTLKLWWMVGNRECEELQWNSNLGYVFAMSSISSLDLPWIYQSCWWVRKSGCSAIYQYDWTSCCKFFGEKWNEE